MAMVQGAEVDADVIEAVPVDQVHVNQQPVDNPQPSVEADDEDGDYPGFDSYILSVQMFFFAVGLSFSVIIAHLISVPDHHDYLSRNTVEGVLIGYMLLAMIIMICMVKTCVPCTREIQAPESHHHEQPGGSLQAKIRKVLPLIGITLFYVLGAFLDTLRIASHAYCMTMCGLLSRYFFSVGFRLVRLLFMGTELLFSLTFYNQVLLQCATVNFSLYFLMATTITMWADSVVTESFLLDDYDDHIENCSAGNNTQIAAFCHFTGNHTAMMTEQPSEPYFIVAHYLYPLNIEFFLLVMEIILHRLLTTVDGQERLRLLNPDNGHNQDTKQANTAEPAIDIDPDNDDQNQSPNPEVNLGTVHIHDVVAIVNTPGNPTDKETESGDDSDKEAESGDESDKEAESEDESDKEAESGDESDKEAESGDESDKEAESGDESDAEAESGNESDKEAEFGDNSDKEAESGNDSDKEAEPGDKLAVSTRIKDFLICTRPVAFFFGLFPNILFVTLGIMTFQDYSNFWVVVFNIYKIIYWIHLIVVCSIGFRSVGDFQYKHAEYHVLEMMVVVSVFGAALYIFFSTIAAIGTIRSIERDLIEATDVPWYMPTVLLIDVITNMFHIFMQTGFMCYASRVHIPDAVYSEERGDTDSQHHQDQARSGQPSAAEGVRDRQCFLNTLLYLVLCNLTMWIVNSFVEMKNLDLSLVTEEYFDPSYWHLIFHLSMPITLFYRFNSFIIFAEIYLDH